MAEGFLKSFGKGIEVYSAGTYPAGIVSPPAVQVMQEVGIDISQQESKSVNQFLTESFDYVITVCDSAKETCPNFIGVVKHRLHYGFKDPVEATGTPEEILAVYRKVRDEIREAFCNFYREYIFVEK
jgi:arsenate reductase